MRDAYAQSLAEFSDNVCSLADIVSETMEHATSALCRADRFRADKALDLKKQEVALRESCEERAVKLLATESPVARDLRQVVSSIYIVEDLAHMAALARHIAQIAARRSPKPAVPERLVPYFTEMGKVASSLTRTMRMVLANPDPELASQLMDEDDAIDELHAYLMTKLTDEVWPHSTVEAVDVALASRFFERFADHAVSVGTRIVYLATGLHHKDYLARREREMEEASQFHDEILALEERFRNQFS
ncbi:phosphate signaling complex PhoU family protein [Corynebacterium aquilae]|uniref:phosphate signaling complex PhoU family protein n=1 Tax=Corynebacterium aquilae TaxID=203263 RepID=UPI0009534DBC|nr:PhoU domain-containing protein [Corynebacterium aquilae]